MGDRLSDVDELNKHLMQVRQQAAELVTTVQKMREVTRIVQERADRAESVVKQSSAALSNVNSTLDHLKTHVQAIQHEAKDLIAGLQDQSKQLSAEMKQMHQRQLSRQNEEGRVLFERLDSELKRLVALKGEVEGQAIDILAEIDQVKNEVRQLLDSLADRIEEKAGQAIEGAQREWSQWRKGFEEEHLRRTDLMVQTVQVQDQWVRGTVETQKQQVADLERKLETKASRTQVDELTHRLAVVEQDLVTRATEAGLKAHESSMLDRFGGLEADLARTNEVLKQNQAQVAGEFEAVGKRTQNYFLGLNGSVTQLQTELQMLQRRFRVATWAGGLLAVALLIMAWFK